MDNIKDLSEEDIIDRYIMPAIREAGWKQEQIRRNFTLTDGQIIVKGEGLSSRKKKKFADIVLFIKPNIPIAVIEAKDNKKSIGHGMQQALSYADMMQLNFVFSSNGNGFLFHNKISTGNEDIEQDLELNEFPSPKDLTKLEYTHKNYSKAQIKLIEEKFYSYTNSNKSPRYYQINAVNSVIKAIAEDKKRILLVMATGTGKTYTAFQIIHRLRKSEKVQNVLFLADRNILVDQTMANDFKPFSSFMCKIKNQTIDTAYEVYLGLYQSLKSSGKDNDSKNDTYKKVEPDFFDLIVVDECHRSSTKDDNGGK